ncbi:hypothetical protein [Halomicrobium urmianum]|uniref:hypothetical protein n=1 Tax=Halomicrobium urmianum TaxID=1586233 RepID=UPI001CD97BCE|nr:hypothetical protein [Halomicrobium urmianum]
MDDRTVRWLRGAAAALVFATAAYHLWWGFPRMLVYLQATAALAGQGIPPDPRPFLFVAFAVAVLAGPYLVTRDVVSLRRAYQAGLALMILSFLAWVVWHETGHGALFADLPAPETDSGHSHGGSVLYTIYDHYVTEPIEGVIKTVELTAVAVFAVLLSADPDARERTAE